VVGTFALLACRGRAVVSRTVVVGVLLVGLCLWLAQPAAATNVSGLITASTTWTQANSPYVMTGNVTVVSGVTLTIEPGVVVQGNASSRTLFVSGSLVAQGEAGDPITFTSTSDTAPGQWTGLLITRQCGSRAVMTAARMPADRRPVDQGAPTRSRHGRNRPSVSCRSGTPASTQPTTSPSSSNASSMSLSRVNSAAA
jgi:hypothetical protein